MHTRTHTHTHTHTHKHACTHAHKQTNTHTHKMKSTYIGSVSLFTTLHLIFPSIYFARLTDVSSSGLMPCCSHPSKATQQQEDQHYPDLPLYVTLFCPFLNTLASSLLKKKTGTFLLLLSFALQQIKATLEVRSARVDDCNHSSRRNQVLR